MTDFTRVTVVGTDRRADVVVASDEPFAGLLPRFLEILGERIADSAHPLTLVRVTGEELDLAAGSSAQTLADGEILHLVRRADAPPPPEVSDVTDAVAESLARRSDTWGDAPRQAVGATLVGAVSLIGGLLATPLLTATSRVRDTADAATSPTIVPVGLLVAGVVLALAALVLGRAGARWTAIACTAAATGLALPIGVALAVLSPSDGIPMAATITVLWAWIALGVGLGIGLRMRSAAVASVVGGVLAAIAVVMWLTPSPVPAGWGVVAVAAVVACGLLPWYAMSAAGLTGLDDQVSAGGLVPRERVAGSLADAYRALGWTTAAVAVPLALAASALLASDDGWSIALGAVTVLVTALRTRSFPLAVQGVFLWAAAGIAVVSGIVAHATDLGWTAIIGVVVVGVVAALLAGIRPAAHQRARLRSLGNALETIAVIAMLPVLLGSFELYARLLETF
ncbi:EsaB/YukD family protein [Curtobacterium sp. Leaf261]|uniref:EsaB/YukD family protein n=1 Tax=Curtobacterium sp. Leaf261 TaxID=1736311 RepID=UPI0006FDF308|nr:EsaB/YukD family protein [Curtobacterium sp. Leaf261]KQO62219.1 hypothetical protein ASF23_10385 [Curtobacterium sp. Leaf261]